MKERLVDCRGMACPRPVIETKKALEEAGGEPVTVVVDNEAARQNVSRFARGSGYTVEVEDKNGVFQLSISGAATKTPGTEMPIACREPEVEGAIYFITTDSLGQGSPDLGAVLMKNLFLTLVEHHPAPAAILLLNTGVYLTIESSPVLEQIRKLAVMGTEVLVCGACLEYYKLKDKLDAGVVSNMFEINRRLTGPHKVIAIS